jgi:hypothetical protein
MLSNFTIEKIANDYANELIEYFDEVYGRCLTTDEVSDIIDNAYINGYVLTLNQFKN